MDETMVYENYPLRIPFLAIFISSISYFIGAIILSGFGIIYAVLYFMYCIVMELFIVIRSCKNCYYHGKICGLGKGKVAPLFVKKGDPKKFATREVSPIHMIPDFLVIIIPIIGGSILLYQNFSYLVITIMIILVIIFFGGTAYIRGSYACKYCKQKEIGCPADKIFNKTKETKI